MESSHTTSNVGGFNYGVFGEMMQQETSTPHFAFSQSAPLFMETPTSHPTFEELYGCSTDGWLSAFQADFHPPYPDSSRLALNQSAEAQHQPPLPGYTLHSNHNTTGGHQHVYGDAQFASGFKDIHSTTQNCAPFGNDRPAESYQDVGRESFLSSLENPLEWSFGVPEHYQAFTPQEPARPPQELFLPAPRHIQEDNDAGGPAYLEDYHAQNVERNIPSVTCPWPLRGLSGLDAIAAPFKDPIEANMYASRPADGRHTRRAHRRTEAGPYPQLSFPPSPPPSPFSPAPSSSSPVPQCTQHSRPRQRLPKAAAAFTRHEPTPQARAIYEQVPSSEHQGTRFILPCLLPGCPAASSPSSSTPKMFMGWRALSEHLIDDHGFSRGRNDARLERCFWPGFVSGFEDGMVTNANHLRTIERLLGVGFECRVCKKRKNGGKKGKGKVRGRFDDVKAHCELHATGDAVEACYDEVYKTQSRKRG